MINDDEKLDDILKARRVPEMRSNLEHRIIQASLQSKPEGGRSKSPLGAWITTILDNIVIPQPALSMALVLLCGILIGGYPVEGIGIDMGDDVDATAFFLIENEIEYGEIL